MVLTLACEKNAEVEVVDTEVEISNVKVESFGVEYVFSDSAIVTANLRAQHVIERTDSIDGREEDVHYFYGEVEIDFFNKLGLKTSTARGDSGRFRRAVNLARLDGNVVLNNELGDRMYTEQLFWDEKKDSIYTDKFVKIVTPDKVITGSKGLRSNSSFSSYVIFGIQGEIEADEQ